MAHLRTFGIVRRTYRQHRSALSFGIFALLAGQFLALLIPKYTKLGIEGIETFSPKHTDAKGPKDLFTRFAETIGGFTEHADGKSIILSAVIALVVVSLLAAIMSFFKRLLLTGLSRRIEFNLRQDIFGHLQRLPLDFYSKMRSGDVISRATSDVESVRMMTGPALMYLCESAVLLPMAVVAMYMVSPYLTMWALVPLVLLTLATAYFSPRQGRYSKQVQERQGDLSARAQENFSGVRVVKAFNRQDFESQSFDSLGKDVYDAQIAFARNRTLFQATIWTLNGVGMLIFLYFGAQEVAAGNATIALLVEFSMYFQLLFWPMIALGWVVSLVIRGRVSARRIDELLSVEHDPGVVSDGHSPDSLAGSVEFKDVSFTYESANTPALSNISFKASPGKVLGIVGPVGCGKSTIAALTLRLRGVSSGAVLIDDKNVDDYQPQDLRKRVGFVPQETFLFSESIAENIAFGLDETNSDDVEEAAGLAQLANDVNDFPHQFHTLLGERGVNLSGGQKQRTAIARALVKKPEIMVLDDCLSAVDTKTEEAILRGLKSALKDTTCMIIAQRVSAIAHADEIIVLDAGRIVERGTDKELRERGGLYAEMAQRQSMAEAIG